MKHFADIAIAMTLTMSIIACEPSTQAVREVKLTVEKVEATEMTLSFRVKAENAERVAFIVGKNDDETQSPETILTEGTEISPSSEEICVVENLNPNTVYKIHVAAQGGGGMNVTESIEMQTLVKYDIFVDAKHINKCSYYGNKTVVDKNVYNYEFIISDFPYTDGYPAGAGKCFQINLCTVEAQPGNIYIPEGVYTLDNDNPNTFGKMNTFSSTYSAYVECIEIVPDLFYAFDPESMKSFKEGTLVVSATDKGWKYELSVITTDNLVLGARYEGEIEYENSAQKDS